MDHLSDVGREFVVAAIEELVSSHVVVCAFEVEYREMVVALLSEHCNLSCCKLGSRVGSESELIVVKGVFF